MVGVNFDPLVAEEPRHPLPDRRRDARQVVTQPLHHPLLQLFDLGRIAGLEAVEKRLDLRSNSFLVLRQSLHQSIELLTDRGHDEEEQPDGR